MRRKIRKFFRVCWACWTVVPDGCNRCPKCIGSYEFIELETSYIGENYGCDV